MDPVQLSKDEQTVINPIVDGATLKGSVVAMVEAARNGELTAKSPEALANASATLPDPKAAPTVSIAEMKNVLQDADCLYDDRKIWKQLGAMKIPKIPDTVIQEAYEKGGRVILRCSSISEKAEALREANRVVGFWGDAEQSHYQESVSKAEWVVVPSHINESTLGSPKSKVVTSEMPAPTPEDWFSAIAYARLDGGRQPTGCEGLYAFTTEPGTVVGSFDAGIVVLRRGAYVHFGNGNIGAARFGPPRN